MHAETTGNCKHATTQVRVHHRGARLQRDALPRSQLAVYLPHPGTRTLIQRRIAGGMAGTRTTQAALSRRSSANARMAESMQRARQRCARPTAVVGVLAAASVGFRIGESLARWPAGYAPDRVAHGGLKQPAGLTAVSVCKPYFPPLALRGTAPSQDIHSRWLCAYHVSSLVECLPRDHVVNISSRL